MLPRPLIFLSSLWLIGSWLISLGVRTPIQPTASGFMPGVRLLLLCVAVGLMIGWPLLRLSQKPAWYPITQTWLDLIVLLGMMQVVIWPLRLVTDWSVERMAAIDATLTGWTILAGAAIAAPGIAAKYVKGNRSTKNEGGISEEYFGVGPRNLAMLTCLGMGLLGPALAWVGAFSGVEIGESGGGLTMELISLGPFMAVRTLVESDIAGSRLTPVQWHWIILLGVAGWLVWTALIMTNTWLNPRNHPRPRNR